VARVVEPPEFERAGRMVVLLTLKEAEALLDNLPRRLGNGEAGRALRVLQHQVAWLNGQLRATNTAEDEP